MELQILRHGKAEDHGLPDGDGARALVQKGRSQARKMGKLLKQQNHRPDVVLTSPVLRAKQTAETFCVAADMPGPVVQQWLACGMGAEEALGELKGFSEFERVMIVGHEPDFSGLVEYLLGCTEGQVEVKKATLVGIAVSPPSRRSQLRYLIPAKWVE